ncbi:class I SAM-dependent methyltransferase [Speluncibacter jeojiensis]|uniref:Class I SAM-dependent methyltransferase n=1 Tax=Speluncibacter jeojiensis TaxID=2710754 RepID=A0A9X4REM9_9ACTN|nr:class I SAM-dependent methyltransferase [Corynebacteriales bacterium D3-21]
MTLNAPRTANNAGAGTKLTLAQVIEAFSDGHLPVRFTAYDGSATGPADAPVGLHLGTPRAVSYLATAPGELGLARAYISGDIEATGVRPGDPYPLLKAMIEKRNFRRPPIGVLAGVVRSLGPGVLRPVAPPPQEARPTWRRIAAGLRHSKLRDANAIHHHYDVSGDFYRLMLGPSMTYTCAVYPTADASLEEAQEEKHRLVFDKLGLQPGDRLLDIGCGWGAMVRYAARRGVRVLGVTLAAEQATWAQRAIEDEGLGDLAQVRFSDYRDVPESGFDAISSMGMTEHIGIGQYPTYFGFFHDKLRPGGRMLNHCVTRPVNNARRRGQALMDRYLFPDGELTGSGRIITEVQNAGLEVLHEENLRPHYAMTLRDWAENLAGNWDAAVDEVGEGTARVWSLMLAGGRLGFDRNHVQLHQVLAVRPHDDGSTGLPLGQWWRR